MINYKIVKFRYSLRCEGGENRFDSVIDIFHIRILRLLGESEMNEQNHRITISCLVARETHPELVWVFILPSRLAADYVLVKLDFNRL